ncbi:hypothetical protein IQ07DRAFT_644700 [Pyrenochaeta sp. DS3sAY3a]|nr:hypothetical protein IQ07DRAFT_644700 [Pyrenochaeta sp. DS3sAY3a]
MDSHNPAESGGAHDAPSVQSPNQATTSSTTPAASFNDTMQAIQSLVALIGGAEHLPALIHLVDAAGSFDGLVDMAECVSALNEDRNDIARHILNYYEYKTSSNVQTRTLDDMTEVFKSHILQNMPDRKLAGLVEQVVSAAIRAKKLNVVLKKERDEWKDKYEVLVEKMKAVIEESGDSQMSA